MEIVFKAAVICMLASVLVLVIKKDSPSIAFLLACASGFAALYLAYGGIKDIVEFTEEIAEMTDVGQPVLKALLKAVGISIVTRIACDLCKESGLSAASSSMELVGAASVFAVSMPLIRTMLSMIRGLL